MKYFGLIDGNLTVCPNAFSKEIRKKKFNVKCRSCEFSSQLVKQYDQDTSFLKGSKLHIAFLLQSIGTKQMSFQKNFFYKNFTHEYWLQIVLQMICDIGTI